MVISPRQIRAARGLLGWEATELGKRTQLSRETIANIEAGRTQARAGSLALIASALIEAGVEFIDQQGVKLKFQGLDLLAGPEGLRQFFDQLYVYARQELGTILQCGIDETKILGSLGTEFSAHHAKRMRALSRERKDIIVRAMSPQGPEEAGSADYKASRSTAGQVYLGAPFYIFAEDLALLDFDTNNAPTVILLKFRATTKAYRRQFEEMWRNASPCLKPTIPKGPSSFE